MEDEDKGDVDYGWCTSDNPQMIDKGTWKVWKYEDM